MPENIYIIMGYAFIFVSIVDLIMGLVVFPKIMKKQGTTPQSERRAKIVTKAILGASALFFAVGIFLLTNSENLTTAQM